MELIPQDHRTPANKSVSTRSASICINTSQLNYINYIIIEHHKTYTSKQNYTVTFIMEYYRTPATVPASKRAASICIDTSHRHEQLRYA